MQAQFTGTISPHRVQGLITGQSQADIVDFAHWLAQRHHHLHVANTVMVQTQDGSCAMVFELR